MDFSVISYIARDHFVPKKGITGGRIFFFFSLFPLFSFMKVKTRPPAQKISRLNGAFGAQNAFHVRNANGTIKRPAARIKHTMAFLLLRDQAAAVQVYPLAAIINGPYLRDYYLTI